MIVGVLDDAVKVAVVIAILLIRNVFPQLMLGQPLNQVCKFFGIAPGFVQ